MTVFPDSFLWSDCCGLCRKRALTQESNPGRQLVLDTWCRQAEAWAGHSSWHRPGPPMGLLCAQEIIPSVTPAALQSDGWRMCSSLHDAKTLTPPREAERESPVPPKRLCLGAAVPEPQAVSLSSRAIRDKRHPLRRHSPAPGEPLHGISTALLSPFPLTTVTAPAALALGMSGWRHIPSPFSPRRRWQRCDGLCWSSRGATHSPPSGLCWSSRGATHSPPSGAAVPARPCRAQAGTSQQEQSRT